MNFTPDRDNVMRRYEFVVITETDETYYYKAQIIICETAGGVYPIEVGTWTKPGKVGCQYVVCGTMQEAINVSYAIADGEYDPDKDYRGTRKRKRTKGR